MRIAVLMCTFRRPEVRQTLASLAAQDLPVGAQLRVVVADNDDTPSARATVEGAAPGLAVEYLHAPARNISIARNACLDAADGADWVAFIDDDEIAPPDWLSRLLACAAETSADAVFGPAVARYGPDAPEWMRRGDLHSNRPERRGGDVRTGHTCNALLRWAGTPWTGRRFDLSRGASGGEDTAYFFDLHRDGARFEICEDAAVHETVPETRLSLRWLLRRRFRSGQSYAASEVGAAGRTRLALSATGKAAICGFGAAATAVSTGRRNSWLLRGALHLGVVAGCLRLRQAALYGGDAEG
ncbi:glycosyltransferase [Jannaschia sp. S6380]|uniref:glycosyltransferase n=1 Tax=Jannaschia sp. S6380 TaxID=2926408 RepID=UPI001FF1C7F8|nr:glycosyltransferase family 2 protein [Jannaschia sp. S6380]MCK0168471.1 glycosyltransferase [Jannaschia sp. S6380]